MSERAISFAKLLTPSVSFTHGDFQKLDGVFDVVTCIETLEHIPDNMVGDFIKGLEEKVKVGGYLVISVPSICKPVHPKHYRHYDIGLLSKQIGQNASSLEMVDVKYMNRDIDRFSSFISKCHSYILERLFIKFYNKHLVYGTDVKKHLRMVAVYKRNNI